MHDITFLVVTHEIYVIVKNLEEIKFTVLQDNTLTSQFGLRRNKTIDEYLFQLFL